MKLIHRKSQIFKNNCSARAIGSRCAKIHIMKYDAFKEVGGNMSFVLVLLDMKNNGIIINSIRSTDGNYIYLKEVEKGECPTPLCKEENIALEEAVKQNV